MPVKSTTKKSSSIQDYYYGTGKRKTSVARVRLIKNGKGSFLVNNKEGKDHFPLSKQLEVINSPLKLTSLQRKFDITAMVSGGGVSAQADALRHGIARALLEYDESLRTTLKKAGFLTRDARKKERKKPGLRRARRAPQFSKR
jgi:small subunit ribosomal protein S9